MVAGAAAVIVAVGALSLYVTGRGSSSVHVTGDQPRVLNLTSGSYHAKSVLTNCAGFWWYLVDGDKNLSDFETSAFRVQVAMVSSAVRAGDPNTITEQADFRIDHPGRFTFLAASDMGLGTAAELRRWYHRCAIDLTINPN
jgi:hypothetical protein